MRRPLFEHVENICVGVRDVLLVLFRNRGFHFGGVIPRGFADNHIDRLVVVEHVGRKLNPLA